MSYANGERPAIGDYVKNKFEQPGTVTKIGLTPEGDYYVRVRWDDGGKELPFTRAKEFTLISRKP
jgi:hypothetical protein